ncbi:TPA: DUF2591 family protein [Enterobacter hormaechei subsp. steigerwaltii]|nr:DUF2591 family protein [Enterobacter hormaechei subsp. steigerwaltii]HCM9566185.1 DUF2591 family protein [Enterobacter hormaechei subsp. steigerwaltii]
MDYSKLSDFEINKRVAQLHGGFALTLAVIDSPPSGKSFHPGRFDPCNSPADAWPIIVDNRISISAQAEYEGDQWVAYCVDSNNDIDETHINPLRAAMVVFLMMQEKQNG